METTKLLIFKQWGTVASKQHAILSLTKSDLRLCFDITCQILSHRRKKEREGKGELVQKQGSEKVGTGNKEGGKNLEFFESSSFETQMIMSV